MGRNAIRDESAPWSFFLPMTLAIVVGLLIAGLAQRGIDAVFASHEVAQAAMPSVPVAAQHAEAAAATPPPQAAKQGSTAATGQGGNPVARQTAVPARPNDGDSLPVLPGASIARRDGIGVACIHGSIALREVNGWRQKLVNDLPVACVEASSIAQR